MRKCLLILAYVFTSCSCLKFSEHNLIGNTYVYSRAPSLLGNDTITFYNDGKFYFSVEKKIITYTGIGDWHFAEDCKTITLKGKGEKLYDFNMGWAKFLNFETTLKIRKRGNGLEGNNFEGNSRYFRRVVNK